VPSADVLTAIEADQTIITSPDPDRFDPSFAATAQLWRINNGPPTANDGGHSSRTSCVGRSSSYQQCGHWLAPQIPE
jgi:hypothetical protein